MEGTITQSQKENILANSYTLLLKEPELDERESLLPVFRNKSTSKSNSYGSASTTLESNPKLFPTLDQPPPASPQILGPFLVVLAAIAFSTNAFLIRVAESVYHFPSLQASFLIFLTTTIISVFYSAVFASQKEIRRSLQSKSRIGLLLLRGVSGALASAACYKSYDYLPVGDAVAIYNVCPALTVIVAFIFLKEKAGITEAISIALSLVGAALVAQPGSSAGEVNGRLTGSLFALTDAGLSAFAYTLVRFLGGSVHFSLSVGAVGFCGTIVVALLGGAGSVSYLCSLADQYGWGFVAIIVAAVMLFVAQSLLDAGLQYCPAGRAMLLRTTEVPFAYFFGMVFLNETPTFSRALGSIIVVSAACVIALRPKRR